MQQLPGSSSPTIPNLSTRSFQNFQPNPVPSNLGAPSEEYFSAPSIFPGLFSSPAEETTHEVAENPFPQKTLAWSYHVPSSTNLMNFQPKQSSNLDATPEVPGGALPTFQNMESQRTMRNTYQEPQRFQPTPVRSNVDAPQSPDEDTPGERGYFSAPAIFSGLFSSPKEDMTVPARPLSDAERFAESRRMLANPYRVPPAPSNLEGPQSPNEETPHEGGYFSVPSMFSGLFSPRQEDATPEVPGSNAYQTPTQANWQRFQPTPAPSNVDTRQLANEDAPAEGGYFSAPAMFSGFFSSPEEDMPAEASQNMGPQRALANTYQVPAQTNLNRFQPTPVQSTPVPLNVEAWQTPPYEDAPQKVPGSVVPTMSTSFPDEVENYDSAEEMEPFFSSTTIEKPNAKWKTATDFHEDFPLPNNTAPQTSPQTYGNSMPFGGRNTSGGSRKAETDSKYYNSLNEEHDQPWPFWIGAGTPAARIEPIWQDGNWYMVAPVDFKGLQNYKDQGTWTKAREFEALNNVDQAVRDLDAYGNIAALPPPRHWKEHKSCPIT